MDTTQLRHVAFLLSLGGLSACGDVEPGPGTGAGTGGTGGTTPTTTEAEASTDVPTTSATGTTGGTSTEGSGSATASGTTGEGSTGPVVTGGPGTSAGFLTTASTGETGDGETGEPPPSLPVCADFGEKFAACYPRYARYAGYYAMYCDTLVAMGGAADGTDCAAALEEYFACLNNLECRQLGAELEMPVECAPQAGAIAVSCPNLGP